MLLPRTFPTSCSSKGNPTRGGCCVLSSVLFCLSLIAAPASALSTAQEITREATAPNSESNHPLPLMGSWSPSAASNPTDNFGPVWQMQMISAGHHLLPWFDMPDPTWTAGVITSYFTLYQSAIQQAATLGLPLAFVGTQWEQDLYMQDPYRGLAGTSSPLVQVPGITPGTTLGNVRFVSSGSGYTVGDVLTVVGGTRIAAAQITVSEVDGTGHIVHESITNGGAYTVLPTNPVTVTGGTGSNATFNIYDASISWQLSPLGAIAPWQSVGMTWGSGALMQQLAAAYPNPPLVLFLSNNEAAKLNWTDANTDQHYVGLYGTGQTDEFKREKFAQGWIDRYRALQAAWRNSLTSAWQGVTKFIAYEAFGPRHFGRWDAWMAYSLYNTNRIDPSPLTWDGGSPSYYLAFNDPALDDVVWSPQVEVMNYNFMLKEAYQLNPNFWYELSTWNGCDIYPTSAAFSSDCQTLANNIPNYTPDRYAGMVQFGMWITRPRVVRDYRNAPTPRSQSEPYFDVLMNAVDRIYTNPTLTSFWRNGQLVANTSRPHPYQSSIPAEYQSASRMFMLTTNLDPPQPWALNTPISVYALARVIGIAPQRQWLVYALAPTGTTSGVQITISGYKTITADATVAGAFYLVDEASSSVTTLGNGDPGGGGCTYSINPGAASAAASGGANSISLTAGGTCAWTAIANASWLSVGSGSSSMTGMGSSAVPYSVSPNSGAARTGTLTVAGQPFTVNQAASCGYTLSATSASAAADGGSGAFNVTAASGCTWTDKSNATWISVTSGASGSGNGSVGYSVAANTGAARSGTLTVAGQTFTVNQAAVVTTCTNSLNPTSASIVAGGGSGTLNVTASSGCAWTAQSNATWISIASGASGSGNGSLGYLVATNTGAARSGTLTVAGQTFTVNQAAVATTCVNSVSPTSANVTSSGGTGSLNVSTLSNCPWTAVSNTSWIKVTFGANGRGNNSATYSVALNSGAARTGTITVGGQTFTVNQAAGNLACTNSLSPTSASVSPNGGNGAVSVSAGAACGWTVSSNSAWITITSGASGSGNGSVGYSVAMNSGPARSGTLTIAGQTFTVSQRKGK